MVKTDTLEFQVNDTTGQSVLLIHDMYEKYFVELSCASVVDYKKIFEILNKDCVVISQLFYKVKTYVEMTRKHFNVLKTLKK